ncbi:glycoside hydrolase family 2 immunoglobulin domain protein beta-sandwich [Aspergillus oryzae]|uniref:Beta-mannosidase B n=1 Tax=Aspergillus oryzae TaxID=5062 RepID=A0A1S9DVB6_ASPOZ|nr:glycoside hydrolase family 2 immunoglobulin domain protein beta-sandwich [Aspergillus oryzae]
MSGFKSLELSQGWQFRDASDSSPEAWRSVSNVPTVVHLDLIEQGVIPDPFIGMNELQVQWVGERDWIYRVEFVPPKLDAGQRCDLLFEGLDTIATVKLNGELILKSDNMFIPHRVDITKHLMPKSSSVMTLDILFESALLCGRERVKQHPEHRFITHQTEAGRSSVRKAGYHWGWDWGPILMTAGPWRPVRLETYTARVEDVWVESEVSQDLNLCRGRLKAQVSGRSGNCVHFKILLRNKVLFESEVSATGDGYAETEFVIQNPALWYPRGYGRQDLHEICVKLIDNHEVQHEVSKLTGFRSVELVQEKDQHGQSFFFRINGIDTFAGGSCWIPGDSFLPRLTPDKYRQWLGLLLEGNQNMIRIWGGGIFEPSAFYSICDELGILVWQDFMFACASYPTYPSFLSSIEEEARVNVKRLRHHPSIVIYAGSNEDYQIQEKYHLDYNFETDKDPQSWLKSTFPARYIYEYLLPKVVEEESPTTPYHPTSPWGGGKHSADPTIGDIHQWNIWHGSMLPYQNFPEVGGRFVSEFGMEAFPHRATIEQFIEDEDEMYPQSLTMDFHNKARDHERRLGTYILENFRIKSDFQAYIHLSQVVQSDAMKFAYQGWRRQWGHGRLCGGALVWQLNDCWPTTSWAVVDYYLRKKPAFYVISRALEPIAVGVSRAHEEWTSGHAKPAESTRYELWAVTSHLKPIRATLSLRCISIRTGADVQPEVSHEVVLVPNGTTEVASEEMSLKEADAFVLTATLSIDGRVISRDMDWPQPYKYLSFRDRGVEVKYLPAENALSITARKPVKGLVFEEADGVWLQDNGIDIVPGYEHIIAVRGIHSSSDIPRWTYIGDDRL